MIRRLAVSSCLCLALPITPAMHRSMLAAQEISRGSRVAGTIVIHDDFNDPTTLSAWTNFATAEGWPDRIERLEIDGSRGSLILTSGADQHHRDK